MAWQASRSSVVRRNGEWPRSEKREIGDSGQGWLPAPLHLACRQGTAHIDTATSCFDHRRTQGMQEIQANTLPPTSSKPVGDGKASRALWIVATGGVSVSWAEHCHQIERAMHTGVVAPPARQAVARPRRSGICLAGTTMCWWCVGCLEGCRGASKNVRPRVGGARCLPRAPGPRSGRAAKARCPGLRDRVHGSLARTSWEAPRGLAGNPIQSQDGGASDGPIDIQDQCSTHSHPARAWGLAPPG